MLSSPLLRGNSQLQKPRNLLGGILRSFAPEDKKVQLPNKENLYHHHRERQPHLTVILQVDPHDMKIFMNRNVYTCLKNRLRFS